MIKNPIVNGNCQHIVWAFSITTLAVGYPPPHYLLLTPVTLFHKQLIVFNLLLYHLIYSIVLLSIKKRYSVKIVSTLNWSFNISINLVLPNY